MGPAAAEGSYGIPVAEQWYVSMLSPVKFSLCSHVTRRTEDEAGGAAVPTSPTSQLSGYLSASELPLFIDEDLSPLALPAGASSDEHTHRGVGVGAIPFLSSIRKSPGERPYHGQWTHDAYRGGHIPSGEKIHDQAHGGDSQSDVCSMSHVAAVGGGATLDLWGERPPASPPAGQWQRAGGQAQAKAESAGASRAETAATASGADCPADPTTAPDTGTVAQRSARARALVARYETDAGIRLAGGPLGGVGWSESGRDDGGGDWEVEGPVIDTLPPPYASIARYGT